MSTDPPREPHTVLDMDPVRNPYAPARGSAARTRRPGHRAVGVRRGPRADRARPAGAQLVLTGLRGVGRRCCSTSCAPRRSRVAGGPGRSRPARSSRCVGRSRPRCTWRCASWSPTQDQESIEEVLGVLKAFALRETPADKVRDRWQPGIDVPAATGRADSGDMEIDLVELLSDAAGVAADIGSGIALFIDEMQDVQPDDVSAICAACHEFSQQGAPLIVVGAGLPHLPAVLSPRRVTPSGSSATSASTASTGRPPTGRCSPPPSGRTSSSSRPPSTPCTRPPTATPTSCRPTARSPGTSRRPRPSPRTTWRWPPRSPRPNSPSASSGPATTAPPPPSASTCTRWPISRPERRGGGHLGGGGVPRAQTGLAVPGA